MMRASFFSVVIVFVLTTLLLPTTMNKGTESFSLIEPDKPEKHFVQEHTEPLYRPFPQNMTRRREYLEKIIGEENMRSGALKYPSIYVEKLGRLGNNIMQLSNAIFLSEALNVSTIYIKKGFCFINENVTTSRGIKIVPTSKVPNDTFKMYHKLYNMGIYGCFPDTRGYEFGNETLKSIPKIKTDDKALYAHIRSGDVFKENPNRYYGQPPLCYYESVISKWGFKKVYILAEDTKNPVINALIGKYNAKLINEDLFTTIGYILSAKNLAMSSGSFVPSLLNLLPDNGDKKIFKYGPGFGLSVDIWKKFYFTDISDRYRESIMSGNWNNTEEQYQIMLDEKCGDKWYVHHTFLNS